MRDGVPQRPQRPRPDDWLDRRLGLGRRPQRKSRDKDDGGVPVEPNRPNGLSGGAAAALGFDD